MCQPLRDARSEEAAWCPVLDHRCSKPAFQVRAESRGFQSTSYVPSVNPTCIMMKASLHWGSFTGARTQEQQVSPYFKKEWYAIHARRTPIHLPSCLDPPIV